MNTAEKRLRQLIRETMEHDLTVVGRFHNPHSGKMMGITGTLISDLDVAPVDSVPHDAFITAGVQFLLNHSEHAGNETVLIGTVQVADVDSADVSSFDAPPEPWETLGEITVCMLASEAEKMVG